MKTLKPCALIILFSLLVHLSYAQKRVGDNSVNQIIGLYIDMKNALVNNDGITVKLKANKLYRIFSSNPFWGLDSDQGAFLADHLGDLMDNCLPMCYTTDKSEQKPCFARFSKALHDVIKGLKINTSTIYWQYCPINNAYWLSEVPVIKNPYYPYKDWATAGKTTETLAANR